LPLVVLGRGERRQFMLRLLRESVRFAEVAVPIVFAIFGAAMFLAYLVRGAIV
jgi:hypothetical protein